MEALHKKLTDGVEFIAVPTHKFKTNILSVTHCGTLRIESRNYQMIGY